MTLLEKQLQQRIAELESQLVKEKALTEHLKQEKQHLLEQFRLAQQKQFGQSAEGFAGQGELFNEAEAIAEKVAEQETVSYPRKKPKRKPLPKDLPRERVVHDIADSEKVCDCCGGDLHKMGEDSSEKLEFIPAQIKVIEHVRPKYACRTCETTGTQNKIKQASMPTTVIKKGIATASLLSQIITNKYQYGLPLHRQETMFKQHGIELSRKTMSEWILKSAKLFEPLVDRLKVELLKQSAIHGDETPVKVVKSDKAKSYMWLYCSGTDSPQDNNPHKNIVLYDFQGSRAASCPIDYLGNYQGYLHADGYVAYEKTQATLVGCWAHARRKFVESKQVQGKNKTGKADVVLSLIQKLYGIESRIKAKTADEKYQIRQQQSLSIIKKLENWLIKHQESFVSKTKLSDAVSYLKNQWPKLITYLDNGALSIDNNRAERAIKPFVIGRKNWLFSKTENGATASATLYSIVETAKANSLEPYDYITRCLNELCQVSQDIDSLLPWDVSR